MFVELRLDKAEVRNREVSATTNDVNYERIEGGFQDFSSLCFDQSYVQRAIEDV